MDHLVRESAPIAARAWEVIDAEARDALKATLAGRRLVDLTGPLGWKTYAIDLGLVEEAPGAPGLDVQVRQRRALPMLELRVPSAIPREKLEAVARGAKHVGLDQVVEAARQIGLAEDRIIFDGHESGGVDGLMAASTHEAVSLGSDYEQYPAAVAAALTRLREAGVDGPFAMALGPRCYTGLTTTTSGGYPVMQHVRRLIDGPIVWAPGIDGACLLSLRGGDHELIVGQDFSIGYLSAGPEEVQLYIEESMTFRNLEPSAAVALRYRERSEDPAN